MVPWGTQNNLTPCFTIFITMVLWTSQKNEQALFTVTIPMFPWSWQARNSLFIITICICRVKLPKCKDLLKFFFLYDMVRKTYVKTGCISKNWTWSEFHFSNWAPNSGRKNMLGNMLLITLQKKWSWSLRFHEVPPKWTNLFTVTTPMVLWISQKWTHN